MQPAPITVGGSVLTRCTPDSVWSGFGRWHPNELAAVVGVLVLVGSDAVALVVAWVSAYAILAPAYSLHDWTQPSMVLLVVCLCVWLAAQGDYTDRKSLDKEFPQTSLVIWLAALLAYRQVGPSIILSLIAIVSLTTARVISRWVLYKGGLTRLPAVVVGSSKACQSLCRVMANDWYRGFSIVDEIICTGAHVDDITTPLAELMKCRRIAHVIVVDGICPSEMRKLEELVDQLRLTLSVGYLLEGSEQRVVADRFFGSGYVSLRRVRSIYALPYPAIKRAFDVLISIILLILVSPIYLAVLWLVRRDGGPAHYLSPRIGSGGTMFMALKFRTMVLHADQALQDLLASDPLARREWETTFKLQDDPRITRLGRFLRQFSVDELPQLINVLRGEMSLVGPRPMLPAEREVYGPAFEQYCRCVPGITGPWQVSGRNDLEYQRRVELNEWYAKNMSFLLDINILLRTVWVVFRRSGAA